MKTLGHYFIRFTCINTGFALFLSIPRLFNIVTGTIDIQFDNFKDKFLDTF
ncbi:hypothetical protein [Neobacillus niacini]|uniref:hypothetical protein n=1 Tax=Neobacillus niacini TaxID=86668 RepID=UPI0021CAE380|nr:hypothetical protein [Neobacillus niacini]MCM3765562.1 hypothetical protein [Neobacillus niacini]